MNSTTLLTPLSLVSAHFTWLITPHSHVLHTAETLLVPWAVQFIMSWVGFFIFMTWDYICYTKGTLEVAKLPSRHALLTNPEPDDALGADGLLPLFGGLFRVPVFWYTQLFMVPLVLFNQIVVWPLVSLIFVWPTWAARHSDCASGGWGWYGLGAIATLIPLMLISDQMWYWSHRLMHTRWAWRNLHSMHHVAPQAALSATYVHPLEYTLFTIAMQLPFAIAGFPVWVVAVPMAWGMVTGSGAHSGYGGDFANGEKHGTGHHLYHSANFGLLMVADIMYGTHWSPGDPPPRPRDFKFGEEIERAYTTVKGAGSDEATAAVAAVLAQHLSKKLD